MEADRFATSKPTDRGNCAGSPRTSRPPAYGSDVTMEEAYMKASGLRPPKEPPADADAFDVVMHHLRHWESEFARARHVVKQRASHVVVGVSSATALIAVVGSATAILGWSWMGILSAALAGVASVLSAWDGLFRHRDLWLQRSLVLGQLQGIHREADLARALEPNERNRIAQEIHTALNDVLADDLMSWSELRAKSASGRPQVESS